MALFDGLTYSREPNKSSNYTHAQLYFRETRAPEYYYSRCIAPKQAWNISKSMFCVVGISVSTCIPDCLENCKYLAHNNLYWYCAIYTM